MPAPILGCMNPAAVNYNPIATQDDGSCYYLDKVNGTCYAFEDATGLINHSFTMSWGTIDGNWVFFHDFIPDFYFSTREQLFNGKSGALFIMNKGLPGIYHNNTAPFPFFIDVVFNSDRELTLNAINWITEVLNPDGSVAPFDTLTHITVWNSYQCSGRVALSQLFKNGQAGVRKTAGRWSFKDFRDMIIQDGVAFLQDIFNNFAVNTAVVAKPAWFNQELMEDNYFVVRFEFDNTSGKKVYLQDIAVDTNQSFR